MEKDLTMVLVAGAVYIISILGSAFGHLWLKPIVVVSGVALIYYGFRWESWLGSLGVFLGTMGVLSVLKATILKNQHARHHTD